MLVGNFEALQSSFCPPHPVYAGGTEGDPVVLVLHELTGQTPETFALAEKLIRNRNGNGGYRVFLPCFFGNPNSRVNPLRGAIHCIGAEFRGLSSGKLTPAMEYVKLLCSKIVENEPTTELGIIGMCMTGEFALAALTDPKLNIVAPIVAQPALPSFCPRKLQLPREELEQIRTRLKSNNHVILGLRNEHDQIPKTIIRNVSPSERFETLQHTFGNQFEGWEVEATEHSTLTSPTGNASLHRFGSPSQKSQLPGALELVLDFLDEKLKRLTPQR